jgi:hypothetical protein
MDVGVTVLGESPPSAVVVVVVVPRMRVCFLLHSLSCNHILVPDERTTVWICRWNALIIFTNISICGAGMLEFF